MEENNKSEVKQPTTPQIKAGITSDGDRMDIAKNIITQTAVDTKSVKDAIDLAATRRALDNEKTVEKLLMRKQKSLRKMQRLEK